MKRDRRTKWLAAIVIALAAGAGAVVVLAFPVLRESWYIHQLGSEVFLDRKLACEALAKYGTARAVPYLFERLVREATTEPPWEAMCSQDRNPFFDTQSEIYWSAIGKIGAPAVSHLVKALRGENADAKLWAANLLGPVCMTVIYHTLEVQGKHKEIYAGDFALDPLPPIIRMVIDALIESLGTEDAALAREVQGSLSSLRQAAWPAVLHALVEGENRSREAAAQVLENTANLDASARSTLKTACKDALPDVRHAAVNAWWLAYQAAVRSLGEGKASPSLEVERKELEAILVAELGSGGTEERNEVFSLLEGVLPWTAETTRKTLALLKDPQMRAEVERTLEEGVSAEVALPVLIEYLRDPGAEVRRAAVDVIETLGERGKTAIPALVPLLQEKDLREQVIRILPRLGPSGFQVFLAALGDNDASIRGASAERHCGLVDDSRNENCAPLREHQATVMAALERHLGSQAGRYCEEAAEALGILSICFEDNRARVTALASSDSATKRLGAVRALAKCGQVEPGTVLPLLLKALEDKNAQVRAAAALALGSVEGNADRVVPALAHALEDTESDVVVANAAGSLFREGLAAKAVAPTLERLLRESRSGDVRGQAFLTLESIHRDDEAALAPALDVALRDTDSDVRRSLREAMQFARGKPGVAALVPVLLRALKTANEDRTIDLVEYMTALNAWIAAAVPVLLDRLRSSTSDELDSRLMESLASICSSDASQVPALVTALQDDKARLRIVRLLGRIGPSARAAAPELRSLARSGDPQLQVEAARALEAVEKIR